MDRIAVDAGESWPGLSDGVFSEVEHLLGLLGQNALNPALVAIETINRASPGGSLSSHLIGLVSLRLGEPGKALDAFSLAHRLAPEIREHSEILGILHARLGHVVDSLYFGKLSHAAVKSYGIPGLVPSWLGSFSDAFFTMEETPLLTRAKFFADEELHALAAQEFRRAIEVDPHSAEAWRGLVVTCQRQNLPLDALGASDILLQQAELKLRDLIRHGDLLAECGQLENSIGYLNQTAAALTDFPLLGLAPIRSLCRRADPTAAPLNEILANAVARLPSADKPLPATLDALDKRRLRIGVIGSQWRPGQGLDPVVPILDWLDQRRVELFVYADHADKSPLARRLQRRADSWHDVTELDDETLNFVIRNDAPDVLIELDGPIRMARPALFLTQPAAVMLSLYGVEPVARMLGFDGLVLPPNRALVPEASPLAVVLACMATLPTDLPAEIPHYQPHDGPPIFGTVAPFGALDEATLALWAEILAAIPGALLKLDTASIGGEEPTAEIKSALIRISADLAIEIVSAEFDAYLGQIDCLLDPPDNPLPHAAITAAGHGVPVFTCASRNPNAALLHGWLKTIGLDELVVPDRGRFIDRLAPLADPAARTALRARLRDAVTAEQRDGPKRRATELTNTLNTLIRNNAPS